MLKIASVWKNKKTGNNYIVRGNAINATNDFEGVPMVLYQRTLDKDGVLWCRTEEEFFSKFELIAE